jgi:eukaryotic-like serine/threonine-protein kinase
LAASPDANLRNPGRAVVLAKKAVELESSVNTLQTLGWALYRSGDWSGSIVALEKSMQLQKGGDPGQWFFLAMAHWRLNNKDEARRWYQIAVDWMDASRSRNTQTMKQVRREAAELLEISESK